MIQIIITTTPVVGTYMTDDLKVNSMEVHAWQNQPERVIISKVLHHAILDQFVETLPAAVKNEIRNLRQ